MSDLREQIENVVIEVLQLGQREGYELSLPESLGKTTDIAPFVRDILTLIPKPTVRVKCDKCSGIGRKYIGGITGITDCPSCTNGGNDHEIVWVIHHCGRIDKVKPLALPDLIDPDVAWAYHIFYYDSEGNVRLEQPIPNNKGSLRIGEKV